MKPSDRLRVRSCLVAIVAATFLSPRVRADETGEVASSDAAANSKEGAVREAASRFERGVRFFDEGDFALALIEFERAYQLVSDYRVLYNIGQVSIQLGRFARARTALESYLERGGAAVGADRVATVRRDLAMLEERTARLSLRCDESSAELFIDGFSRGITPLEGSLLLDAGEHEISLRKAGFVDFQKHLILAGAEEVSVEAKMVRVQTAAPASVPSAPVQATPRLDETSPPPDPAGAKIPWRSLVWIGAGTTGLASVALVVGGFAARSELEKMKEQPGGDFAAFDVQAGRANSMFLAADVLAATTVGLAGFAVYLELTKSPENSRATPTSGRGTRLAPSLGGAALLGSF